VNSNNSGSVVKVRLAKIARSDITGTKVSSAFHLIKVDLGDLELSANLLNFKLKFFRIFPVQF
jgi:hypothetical protein